VIASNRAAFLSALALMFVFACSSSSSSSGCGSSGCSGSSASQRCDINVNAVVCPHGITLECFGDTKPDAKSQCEQAIKQDDEVVYCCTNASDSDGGAGGAGG
jgi:hypothetical protein